MSDFKDSVKRRLVGGSILIMLAFFLNASERGYFAMFSLVIGSILLLLGAREALKDGA